MIWYTYILEERFDKNKRKENAFNVQFGMPAQNTEWLKTANVSILGLATVALAKMAALGLITCSL